jgi:protoporphyrinogen oxidase
MKSIVIVGGGISGITTALFLKDHYKVTLIEKDDHLGGLLSSIDSSSGYQFDFGTHIIKETGIEEIDNLLFKTLSDKTWNSFPIIKTGCFFNSQNFETSPFLNISSLEKNDYEQAVKDLKEERSQKSSYENLYERSLNRYGKTITEKVIAKAIKKQFNCELKDLPESNPFFMKRVVCKEL